MGMASVLCGLLTIYAVTCPHLLNAGRVAQGTCAIHVIDREHRVISGCVLVVGDGLDWWTAFVTNETLLGLDVQITVMDVVDFRRYLCLHQRCDGIFWDGTALLTSIQTAKERPPPEPPPAWWISPEPPQCIRHSSSSYWPTEPFSLRYRFCLNARHCLLVCSGSSCA